MALKHSADIPSHPQANLSGWFERHTSLWPVRRWLELRGPTLTYRHSRNGDAHWSADLRECTVSAGSRSRELVIERPSNPRLSLFAPSLAELKLWFTELKRVSDGIHDFYHLAAQISHSAHGPIVLGREKSTDEQAAVFVQRKADVSAWTMWALTRRDNRVLDLCQTHASTVYVRDVFETTRNFYVVTELVTGGPLRDALTRARGGGKPLGVAIALSVVSDVLRALAHLHAAGVVHGCVDPSHVLCMGGLPGRVKLVVFGVAAGIREAGAFGRGPGVAGDAPEVMSFRRRSGASDVFSAGMLLFELLTGVKPFGAGDVCDDAFSTNVLGGALMDADNADAWNRLGAARSLLDRMLEHDAAKRPSARECLTHEWFDGVDAGRARPLARFGSDPKTVILDFEQGGERRGRVSQETDVTGTTIMEDGSDDGMGTIPTVDEEEEEEEENRVGVVDDDVAHGATQVEKPGSAVNGMSIGAVVQLGGGGDGV